MRSAEGADRGDALVVSGHLEGRAVARRGGAGGADFPGGARRGARVARGAEVAGLALVAVRIRNGLRQGGRAPRAVGRLGAALRAVGASLALPRGLVDRLAEKPRRAGGARGFVSLPRVEAEAPRRALGGLPDPRLAERPGGADLRLLAAGFAVVSRGAEGAFVCGRGSRRSAECSDWTRLARIDARALQGFVESTCDYVPFHFYGERANFAGFNSELY